MEETRNDRFSPIQTPLGSLTLNLTISPSFWNGDLQHGEIPRTWSLHVELFDDRESLLLLVTKQ